jgi:hypothetical protein
LNLKLKQEAGSTPQLNVGREGVLYECTRGIAKTEKGVSELLDWLD